jgi:hypothetical protein
MKDNVNILDFVRYVAAYLSGDGAVKDSSTSEGMFLAHFIWISSTIWSYVQSSYKKKTLDL